ncbi:lipase family protein [Promicromonospora soli]|uniref:Lipase n=1 Tax=Promicromonospora soli TaxID=2035533 RepID=A0A919KMZ2_9MICO|nr:lipase family protein [Promicromonospora soli]GHH65851.1 lipase [Promicromonospora soli]
MPLAADPHTPASPPSAPGRGRTARHRAAVVATLAALVLPAVVGGSPVAAHAAPATTVPPASALPATTAPATSATAVTAPAPAAHSAAVPAPLALDDDFYTPPDPLPDGADGEVVRWREEPRQLSARNYLVMYHSTNATGHDVPVTGRVLVPGTAWRGDGPRPIVSVASGTRGVGDSCAPSRWLDYERPFIEPMLLAGWAVVVTDYEGLGTPGMHTYVVGQSEGRAVIDMVRAATNLPATGLRAGGKVAFSGYSQGGGGAMWAGELQPDYAPELDLVGVAAGGVPADLTEVAESLDGQVGFGFLLLAAYGLDAAYPELDLDSYLNERGRETFEREKDACVDVTLTHAFQNIGMFTATNPLRAPDWQARLDENRLGANPPDVPIRLFHGTLDEIIAPGQARTLRNEYCAAGAEVQWEWHVGEHVSTMVTGAPGVVAFLDRRFRDRPFLVHC